MSFSRSLADYSHHHLPTGEETKDECRPTAQWNNDTKMDHSDASDALFYFNNLTLHLELHPVFGSIQGLYFCKSIKDRDLANILARNKLLPNDEILLLILISWHLPQIGPRMKITCTRIGMAILLTLLVKGQINYIF